MKSCFEKISDGVDCYFRKVYDEDDWNLYNKPNYEDTGSFSDDNGKKYLLSSINEVGFLTSDEGNISISTIYIVAYDEKDEIKKIPIKVSDAQEVSKIKNYVDSNKCSID